MPGAYDADPVFQANPAHLDYLLQRVNSGALTIPDFQRDFTWEPKRTAFLLRSMMSRFPAGTFLFWEVGEENKMFGHRPVEGAPAQNTQPNELILDGQQRLTSLYRALNGIGEERFYLSIRDFVKLPTASDAAGVLNEPHDVEFEKAVTWHPIGTKEAAELDTRESRIAAHMFAVDEHRVFDEWLDEYAVHHAGSMDPRATKSLLRRFRDTYLVPLRSYGFPVVTLPSHTRIEAVATVFETINSTGKALGPFELLTARFYPENVRLRDLWEQAVVEYDILADFGVDAYSILQAVTLRAHNSAQRSDVLRKLTATDVQSHWDAVARGFARSLELLRDECGVVTSKLLPYSMLLVPMAATWEELTKTRGPERANVTARMKQFFWCSVFSTNYDQGANSQAGADYAKLRGWLFNPNDDAPEAVKGFALSATTLRSATTRRKALNAGILALTVTSGARDFHTGAKLTAERVRTDKIDSHHIFPKAYLSGKGMGAKSELILNRALIDPVTNKAIGAKAPSEYFRTLRETIEEETLAEILRSQLIDSEDGPVYRDDYSAFIEHRLDDVIAAIETVTQGEVARDDRPKN